MPEAAENATARPGRHRSTEIGLVVSRAGNKTIVVEVGRRVQDRLYARFTNKRKKFYTHDEKNECQVGDYVRILATRRLSKQKTWRVQQIVAKATLPALRAEAESAAAS